MAIISDPLQFEWDTENSGKNKRSHDVEDWECEEVFFDSSKDILKDKLYSELEGCYIFLGKTRQNRLLYLVFTVRNEKVRVISASDVTKREEIELYEKTVKVPKFKNEDEERVFWSKVDLGEHFGPGDFERVSFPNLKPTTRPVSIRISVADLNRVKERANETNVPYQSLIKEYIHKGVASPR